MPNFDTTTKLLCLYSPDLYDYSFQRMGSDPASLPDRCIDLSHCHVMWESIGKRGKDCTIRFISDVTDMVSSIDLALNRVVLIEGQ